MAPPIPPGQISFPRVIPLGPALVLSGSPYAADGRININRPTYANATSSSHTTTPAPAPPPETEGQTSAIINSSANDLMGLFQGEQEKLSATYAADLNLIQLELASFEAKGTRTVAAVSERAVEYQRQLLTLRAEHERLVGSLAEVGLEYVTAPREEGRSQSQAEGRLRWTEAMATIVDDFVLGARMQEEKMRGANGEFWKGMDADEALLRPVGPKESFGVFRRVLTTGRAYVEAIEKELELERTFQW